MPKGINNKTGIASSFKHGLINTKFWRIWVAIRARCFNKKNDNYKWYGGRGIKVCKRWLKFENFRDDMYQSYLTHVKEFGERETTIDRIDNNGNYELKNCSWKTIKEQANHTRSNHLITYNRKTLTIAQWADETKLSQYVIKERLVRLKWTIKDTLTKPLQLNQFKAKKSIIE